MPAVCTFVRISRVWAIISNCIKHPCAILRRHHPQRNLDCPDICLDFLDPLGGSRCRITRPAPFNSLRIWRRKDQFLHLDPHPIIIPYQCQHPSIETARHPIWIIFFCLVIPRHLPPPSRSKTQYCTPCATGAAIHSQDHESRHPDMPASADRPHPCTAPVLLVSSCLDRGISQPQNL